MANKAYEENDIANIAVAIREKTGTDKKYYVSKMAEGVNETYDAGFEKGIKDFLDGFTNNGARKGYTLGFRYTNFDGIDKFPYTIYPSGAGEVFYNYRGSHIPEGIDFSQVTLSKTDNAKRPYKMFLDSPSIIKIRDIGLPQQYNYEFTYAQCTGLEEIEIVRNFSTTTFPSSFKGCKNLKRIRFSDPIGRSIDFGACPLQIDALKHIAALLVNYKDTENEEVYTLTLSLKSDYILCNDAGIHYNDTDDHKRGDPLEGITPKKYKVINKDNYLTLEESEDGHTILEIITQKGWKYVHLTYNP